MLISDCAILAAEIYHRQNNEPISERLPKRTLKWSPFDISIVPKAPKGIWVVGGLGFEVWSTNPSGESPVVALVFRGTRFTKLADWFSNLRWLTKYVPFTWDQYDEARHAVKHVIESLKKEFGESVTIVAVGHSLGGGLAQHAGYSSNEIKTVYAFNPSPVTGFYSVPRAVRERNAQQMRILRIYEHGEILAFLRLALRPFYPLSFRDPEITEVRFNFGHGNAIKEHNMARFALGLKRSRS
jgi:pimeloyl-ACP methyl ester carboxylesterase